MSMHAEQLKELQEEAYLRVLRVFRKLRTGQVPEREKLLFNLKRELTISEPFHITCLQQLAEEPDIERGKKASTSRPKNTDASKSKGGGGGGGGGGGSAPRPGKSTPGGGPAPVASGPALDPAMKGRLDQLRKYMGKVVNVWWDAETNPGYYRGLITDVDVIEEKFCVAYDLGTEYESFEWIPVNDILNGEPAYVILPDAPVDVTQLPPPGGRVRGAAAPPPAATPATGAAKPKPKSSKQAKKTAGSKKKKKAASSDEDFDFEDFEDEDFDFDFGR